VDGAAIAVVQAGITVEAGIIVADIVDGTRAVDGQAEVQADFPVAVEVGIPVAVEVGTPVAVEVGITVVAEDIVDGTVAADGQAEVALVDQEEIVTNANAKKFVTDVKIAMMITDQEIRGTNSKPSSTLINLIEKSVLSRHPKSTHLHLWYVLFVTQVPMIKVAEMVMITVIEEIAKGMITVRETTKADEKNIVANVVNAITVAVAVAAVAVAVLAEVVIIVTAASAVDSLAWLRVQRKLWSLLKHRSLSKKGKFHQARK